MDSEYIMVAIVDSDQPIEARRCRLVHLSDGTRAALWRGLAWPIGPGDRIDVAGPASPLLPEALSPDPRFGLVDGDEEAWLVLEGSVTVRDAAVTALRRAGVGVLRTGPWLGDPVDGVVGANFIRFARPQVSDLRLAIVKILEDTVTTASAKPEPAGRIRALMVELMETRAALARAQTAPSESRQHASAEAEAELARVQQENAALLREIADLQAQLAEAPPARAEPNRAAGRLHHEIAVSLASFRPDLRFLRDSLMVVAGEFSDRRGLYRAVLEIRSEALGPSWKKIHGTSGWWERHVSNGQDDSGRIYARRGNGNWELLVSHKAQQARDINWLNRQP
jgi:cell division protein FtsB